MFFKIFIQARLVPGSNGLKTNIYIWAIYLCLHLHEIYAYTYYTNYTYGLKVITYNFNVIIYSFKVITYNLKLINYNLKVIIREIC